MTPEVARVALSLGLTPEALRACATPASLEQLKADVKKAYRRRALELHPDRGGNAEEFKRLANAYSQIEKSLESLDVRGYQGYRVTSVTIIPDPVKAASGRQHFSSNWWNRAG